MGKCAACGKFMTSREGVTCPICKSQSHNACVRVPVGTVVTASWRCGECQANAPKGRNQSTPVRAALDDYHTPQSQSSGAATVAVLGDTPSTPLQDSCNADSIELLREDMRSEFKEMRQIMTSEFRSYKDDMGSFFDEMRELKQEISATRSIFNERMDAFESRMTALEQARDSEAKSDGVHSLEQALVEVRMQLNDREQEYLLNDVVITGLQEENGENPTHLVCVLATSLGISLDERDIVVAEREGAPRLRARPSGESPSQAQARARRVVVRFARRSTRDAYLQAARVRRGLQTAELGFKNVPPTRIYVNERFTRTNGQLFGKTRELAKAREWKYCWSRDGRIFVRKEHGAPYFRVRQEKDIDRIFGGQSV